MMFIGLKRELGAASDRQPEAVKGRASSPVVASEANREVLQRESGRGHDSSGVKQQEEDKGTVLPVVGSSEQAQEEESVRYPDRLDLRDPAKISQQTNTRGNPEHGTQAHGNGTTATSSTEGLPIPRSMAEEFGPTRPRTPEGRRGSTESTPVSSGRLDAGWTNISPEDMSAMSPIRKQQRLQPQQWVNDAYRATRRSDEQLMRERSELIESAQATFAAAEANVEKQYNERLRRDSEMVEAEWTRIQESKDPKMYNMIDGNMKAMNALTIVELVALEMVLPTTVRGPGRQQSRASGRARRRRKRGTEQRLVGVERKRTEAPVAPRGHWRCR